MIKNLGGEWDVGRHVVERFVASIPEPDRTTMDFSVRWGSGKCGGTTLVFDLGWFRRSWNAFKEIPGGYYQIGVNHINWLPYSGDRVRWEALQLDILPATEELHPRPNVLLIGQVAHDAQHGLSQDELEDWLHRHSNPKHEVIRYRPHPQGGTPPQRSLDEDLEWAEIVVTYNSTVGLEALRRGIPVRCSSNCFYRELSIENLGHGYCPSNSQRAEFFARVATAQWTLEEISNGKAYEFYRHFL